MCDYSLHDVTSAPAMVGDKLTTTQFPNAITRGFSDPNQPRMAASGNCVVVSLAGRDVTS